MRAQRKGPTKHWESPSAVENKRMGPKYSARRRAMTGLRRLQNAPEVPAEFVPATTPAHAECAFRQDEAGQAGRHHQPHPGPLRSRRRYRVLLSNVPQVLSLYAHC